jgi:hypothetical protein
VVDQSLDLTKPVSGQGAAEPSIYQLISSRLPETLFWPSCAPSIPSVWHGHVTFAHWIMAAVRPRLVVELGTHYGVSFIAFCNAVQRLELQTECFAIDTWAGDEHTGAYSDKIYVDLARFVESRFPEFAHLMRDFFDNARPKFADGTIDLLHIDGLHTYEAVSHDFRTWLPKMSPRGVMLFHDVSVHDRDFGVWRLWDEITPQYPHFSFAHSAGLGVLAVGNDVPQPLLDLCTQSKVPEAGHLIRQRFESLAAQARRAGGCYESVVAHAIGSYQNIALGRVTTQSSVSAFGNDRRRHPSAVDGIKSGAFGFHTEFEDKAWWQVDLGRDRDIAVILIYNRLDGPCAARARHLRILLSGDNESWDLAYQHDTSLFGGVDGLPLIVDLKGRHARYVRIDLRERNALHLDQVEIYGPD